MATQSETVPAASAETSAPQSIFERLRIIVWPASAPPVVDLEAADALELRPMTLLERIRKFLWLSSGLFSAACFAIPVFGLMAVGSFEGIGTNFLAAVASACLFGITSLLHFGPDEV